MTNLERDNAIDQARYDTVKAAERARRITDPRYRAEALAWIGYLAADRSVAARTILEATASARKVVDSFERTFIFCWPIRAMIEKGREADALSLLDEALRSAGQIENPVSKADALFQLWQAAAPLGAKLPGKITAALCSACVGAGQKAVMHLRDAALMSGEKSPQIARSIIAAIPDGRYKRQAERRLAQGEYMNPRPFFWMKESKTKGE
jgi:hypothetical protein